MICLVKGALVAGKRPLFLLATIFGVNVGFEFLSKGHAQQMHKDSTGGFLLDVFILRFMFLKY